MDYQTGSFGIKKKTFQNVLGFVFTVTHELIISRYNEKWVFTIAIDPLFIGGKSLFLQARNQGAMQGKNKIRGLTFCKSILIGRSVRYSFINPRGKPNDEPMGI